jgi:hypothetical protein
VKIRKRNERNLPLLACVRTTMALIKYMGHWFFDGPASLRARLTDRIL